MTNNKKTVEKGRDWTFIVYPESAPKNWRDILDETHMRWVESPLHDKDLNPDKEIKKPHYHILLSADGPITYNQVVKIIEPLNAPIPKKVGSAKGLIRYMAHLDNPEKYQYSIDEIVGHGGADIASYFELTKTDKMTVMKEIIQYIHENKIDNYADFLMICIGKSDDWFDVAINYNTLAINKMIDGIWQKANKAGVESYKYRNNL
ncbi:replication protein [Streptococcus pneumoniae]|nr:replication protein [Streptococcus pneumoniae]